MLVLNSFEDLFETVFERRVYLFELLVQHFVLSLTAVILIVVIGVGIGISLLRYRGIRQVVLGIVNFLYTIPSIAMFGLFIPLVGIGFVNALVVLVIYGLLPMIRSTYTGLSEVNPHLIDAAKGMGATPSQVFFRVRWPLGFPTILSGFRTMVVMTIALAGLASFIGAGGLGQAIYRGINTNNSNLILAGSISVALLALVTDIIIGFFEKLIRNKKFRASRYRRIILSAALFLLFIPVLLIVFNRERVKDSRTDVIVVATKPTSEQYILGEIISRLIESNTKLQVKRVFGIGGGTSNIHPGMLSGEIDIYPEYTGTAWLFVLKKKKISDPDSLFTSLQRMYNEEYGLTWVARFGFNNTYTLVLPEATAERDDIESISDLSSKSKQFTFGAEFDFFEREDGFHGLSELYSLKFNTLVELDINLKFNALENKTVDVINAFSTDSRIKQMNLRTLRDNKNYFSVYQAGIVVRQKTLEKYPELKKVLEKAGNTINDSTMTMLNYQVEILNKSPEEVAEAFLKSKGIIKQP
ncbi:MAG: ABC transporter permease/substrate-binding protein [Eubacteriaceae bacterium]|nr:ABC transporter permease/substrate-binding protein [Eubacteriaceae bacterium]